MLRSLRRVCADQSGATSIEYAMIAVAIGVVILAALNTTGSQLVALLTPLLAAFG
jgi:Flp pilus assembly pilin Flp